MAEINEDTPLVEDPPTIGDAIRVLERQLVFWRRCAVGLGTFLGVALIIILVGGGALISIASSNSDAARDAKAASDAAKDSSESNHAVLAIIQAQTGPDAQKRQAKVLTDFQHTVDCNVRIAAAELLKPFGSGPPAGYLDGCPTSRTTPTTEAP